MLVQADVQAGQQLLERWGTRNEAIAQLEAVMDEVSGPVTSHLSPGRRQDGMPRAPSQPIAMLIIAWHNHLASALRAPCNIICLKFGHMRMTVTSAALDTNHMSASLPPRNVYKVSTAID